MSKRLYVGNLPYSADDAALRDLFSQHGAVTDVHVASDRETGRSRGFGFVSFATEEEAQAAASALNGHSMDGRPLVVNVARERNSGPPRASRDGAPRRPGPAREPSMRPIVPVGDSPFEEEETRRTRHRSQKAKKRPTRERERGPRSRGHEDDEGRGGSGSWRQWLDDLDDED